MTRRAHAIVILLVALLVVAACGLSFAAAANASMSPCGPEKGWATVTIDHSPSGKPAPDVPAVQVGSVDVSEPRVRWAGVDVPASASSRPVLVRPLAPRAPPLV